MLGNKPMLLNIALLFKHSALLSLKWASIFSVMVTLVIVLWEWLENPGGIFHGVNGTQWQFVYDTAISWLLPTLGYSMLLVFSTSLIYLTVKQLKATH